MKIQPAQISIPKPCHEDWNKMTPNEKGSFCSKCSKTVIDFTKKTVNEITTILENSGNKVCGRFMSDQLDQTYPISELNFSINALPKQISFSNAFVVVLFIVFGTTLFSCNSHSGETVGEVQTVSVDSSKTIMETDSLTKLDKCGILNDPALRGNSPKASQPNNEDQVRIIKGEVVSKSGPDIVKDTARIDSAGILPKVGKLKIFRGDDQ